VRGNLAVRAAAAVALVLLSAAFTPLGAPPGGPRYDRSVERYEVPDVTLVDQEGRPVRAREALGGPGPVILDFIYGTCTTICPVLSAGFASLQRRLGDESDRVRLVSISIDPEHDTPEVTRAYLERYRARPGWDFLTGSREDVDALMRAFEAYVPNKMQHFPLTFLRRRDGAWVRLYGLIGTAELLGEYRRVTAPEGADEP